MSIEAMKQALEALEEFGNHYHACPQWPTYSEPEKYPKCNCGYDDAITSLRQAIAEAEKQKPVAWQDTRKTWVDVPLKNVLNEKREWVGLTDEEWTDAHKNSVSLAGFRKSVEALLKEKNHDL